MRRFQLVVDEGRAREIEGLAREYDLTEREVLEQLVALGLEQVSDADWDVETRSERLRE